MDYFPAKSLQIENSLLYRENKSYQNCGKTGVTMKYIIVLLVWLLGGFASEITAKSTAGQNNVTEYFGCDETKYTYIHIWIDGVRWMFVYSCDGTVVNAYPDPED